MPPTVEGLEVGRFQKPFFSIDLEGTENFDAERFDQQANEVIAANDEPSNARLKFVVVGSRMAIFSSDIMHVDAYMSLPDKYDGELLCGGMVTVRENKRIIWGNSVSLKKRRLKLEASDNFKNTVLQSELGEYFEIH